MLPWWWGARLLRNFKRSLIKEGEREELNYSVTERWVIKASHYAPKKLDKASENTTSFSEIDNTIHVKKHSE